MKRFLVLCLIAMVSIACKDQEKSTNVVVEVNAATSIIEDENTFKGEFVYLEDAAVLTTKNEIYAVRIDSKMEELNALAVPLKKTQFDMVNVIVKGELVPNPLKQETGEGWDQMMIINEILEVTPATSAAVVAPIK